MYGINYLEYADDIAICFSGIDENRVVTKINNALEEIRLWIDMWGQEIGLDKTKAMFFTNRCVCLGKV